MTTLGRLNARRRAAHGFEDVLNTQQWMADGNCAGLPPEEADRLFFSDGRVPVDARALCSSCPVAEACRGFAEANREEYGVWGGQRRTREDTRQPLSPGLLAEARELLRRDRESSLAVSA